MSPDREYRRTDMPFDRASAWHREYESAVFPFSLIDSFESIHHGDAEDAEKRIIIKK
jgi:hypothetical protein